MNSTIKTTTQTSLQTVFINYADLKAVYLIISIVNFVFVLFGTIGNLFTFLILIRKSLRKVYSYTRYLSALCIIDIICLYNWNFTLIYQDILSKDGMRIEYYTPLSCRLFSFCAYSSLQLSSWVMCAIGLDRIALIVSAKRKKAAPTSTTAATDDKNKINKQIGVDFIKTLFKPFRNALAIVLILTFIILSINFVVLINNAEPFHETETNETTFNNNSSNQTRISKFKRTFTCYAPFDFFKIWDIFHVFMYSLVPFCIIFIQNFIVAFLTIKHSNKMKRYETTVSVTAPTTTTFTKGFTSTKSSSQSTRSKKPAAQSKGSYVKNLLIFLTLSFFCTTLPYSMIYATNLNDILSRSFTGIVIKRCLTSLQYTRHSTNFLIYILTSTIIQNEIKKFFQEIKTAICRKCI